MVSAACVFGAQREPHSGSVSRQVRLVSLLREPPPGLETESLVQPDRISTGRHMLVWTSLRSTIDPRLMRPEVTGTYGAAHLLVSYKVSPLFDLPRIIDIRIFGRQQQES